MPQVQKKYPIRLDYTPFRRIRRGSDITVEALSKATNVSRWTIHRLETNQASPSMIQMVALAQQLGVAIHTLFKVEPNTRDQGDS